MSKPRFADWSYHKCFQRPVFIQFKRKVNLLKESRGRRRRLHPYMYCNGVYMFAEARWTHTNWLRWHFNWVRRGRFLILSRNSGSSAGASRPHWAAALWARNMRAPWCSANDSRIYTSVSRMGIYKQIKNKDDDNLLTHSESSDAYPGDQLAVVEFDTLQVVAGGEVLQRSVCDQRTVVQL